jgi:hypothetical protein
VFAAPREARSLDLPEVALRDAPDILRLARFRRMDRSFHLRGSSDWCLEQGGGAWMAEVILFSICHNTKKEYQKWHFLI